jgi:20S proteasome alpha/beta subunit
MGSGSLAAMAVFEAEYKDAMTLDEAKALVQAAIMSGINNDLGSGGSVDMLVRTSAVHELQQGSVRTPYIHGSMV